MGLASKPGGLVKDAAGNGASNGHSNGHSNGSGNGHGGKHDHGPYDEYGQWAADADVFMPEARRASLLSAGSVAGRRISSLGSLHHAGHSESACCLLLAAAAASCISSATLRSELRTAGALPGVLAEPASAAAVTHASLHSPISLLAQRPTKTNKPHQTRLLGDRVGPPHHRDHRRRRARPAAHLQLARLDRGAGLPPRLLRAHALDCHDAHGLLSRQGQAPHQLQVGGAPHHGPRALGRAGGLPKPQHGAHARARMLFGLHARQVRIALRPP